MKGGSPPQGFTVIEVMIFLAVSLVLLASALTLIAGKQAQTEFAQATRDINSKIQDVINDTSTGFFPSNAGFDCTATPVGPTFAPGTNAQGTNKDCIFIGKVMQFSPGSAGAPGGFNIFTVVGLRQVPGVPPLKEVSTIDEAKPTPVALPFSTVDLTEKGTLTNGLQVTRMVVSKGGVSTPTGAVGFFSGFGQYSAGAVISGAQTTNVFSVPGTDINSPSVGVANAIKSITEQPPNSDKNPDGGIIICFQGNSNQKAAVTIGSNGRQTTTALSFGNAGGVCP